MAQEIDTDKSEKTYKKNEAKINFIYALHGYFEGSYERLLDTKSSIGIVVGKEIKKTNVGPKHHLIAYYRIFFGEQMEATGFFIEANAAYWVLEENSWGDSNGNGLGIAVGTKVFRGNKFHGELLFGLGRTLKDDSNDFEVVYPRIALSLGYRF